MAKPKLYILTGFLGSGKTTVLLELLKKKGDKKIGVIQNEFGKVSIDGEILEKSGVTMTKLSNGSIFCTCLQLKFVEALAEMSKMDLDEVYVESSGLADPSNFQTILDAAAVLTEGSPFVLGGVICLVDPVSFLDEAKELEAVTRQIIYCNLAVINKKDMVSEEKLEAVKTEISRLNSGCRIYETSFGAIPQDILEEDLTNYGWEPSRETTINASTKPKTFSITFDGPVPGKDLTAFLEFVLPECYRIKGFANIDGKFNQVDVVTDRIDLKPCSEKECSTLVFISRVSIKLLKTIDTGWKTCVGLPVKLHN